MFPALRKIQARHKIIVAMPSKDSPPFFMTRADGQTFGLDVDIATDLASRLGVDLEIERSSPSYDAVVDQVSSHKADIGMGHLTKTLARATRARFTSPYVVLKHVIVLNRVAAVRLKLGDPVSLTAALNSPDITIGEVTGSSFVPVVKREFPRATLKTFSTEPELFDAIAKGSVTAGLWDEIAPKYWKISNPRFSIDTLTIVRPDRASPISIVTHWSDEPLVAWLDLYLETIRTEGALSRWTHEYLEDQKWRTQLKN